MIATIGDRQVARRIMPTRSYLSQVEPVAVFGLGDVESIDRLEIRWPDGETTVVDGPIGPGRVRYGR